MTIACAGVDRLVKGPQYGRATRMAGHLHAMAKADYDQGQLEPGRVLPSLALQLRRTPEQQAELDKLLVELQDPTSPNYRKWLTPEQFAERFGASEDDVAVLGEWLEQQGLKVEKVARTRTWIRFSGTAGTVEQAFHPNLRRLNVRGEEHYANLSEPTVPAPIASVVSAIRGLHDFRPKPAQSRRLPLPHTLVPMYNYGGGHALAPGDLLTIYNIAPLATAGYTGAGVSVAVIGGSQIQTTDIDLYRSSFGLSAADLTVTVSGTDPGPVAGWDTEALLDLEMVSAVAPDAKLYYVLSTDVWGALSDTIANNTAPIISMSFGTCEADNTKAWADALRTEVQQAVAQGQTLIASSGDAGAAGCDTGAIGVAGAQRGLIVSLPASVPEVTAVGGTEFIGADASYWDSTQAANGGSALSYIPELAWNDSTAELAASGTLAATGGGKSSFFTKPLWQSAAGVPADFVRDVPDVALAASGSHDGYVIAANGALSTDTNYTVGGTSAAAPAFAGIVALVNQFLVAAGEIATPGLGNINTKLYQMSSTAPAAFHDIIVGDNIVPCKVNTKDCPASGRMGFMTTPGYDMVTGLGSVDAFLLASNWAGNGSPSPTIASITPASAVPAASSFQMTITGTGYLQGAVVKWTTAATALTPATTTVLTPDSVNSTAILVTIPASLLTSVGTATVKVMNASGLISQGQTFTITLAPTITSFNPPYVVAGATAFPLAINGTGFVTGAKLSFGGTELATTFVNPTKLTAIITSNMVSTVGPVTVHVTNPSTSQTADVTYQVTQPAPVLSSLSVTAASAGGAAFTITATGKFILSGAKLMWGTTALTTTFVSSTQVTADITSTELATAGAYPVTIANPDTATSKPITFSVNRPAVITLSPGSVGLGSPSFTLTVNGTNFVSGSTVKLGQTLLTTTFVSATQLTAAVPSNLLTTAAVGAIMVVNPGGSNSAGALSLVVGAPKISSYLPAAIAAGSPTFTLTVNGANFLSSSSVLWAGTPLATSYVSPTQLTADVPATLIARSGMFPITVLNVAGTSASAALNYSVGLPTITTLTPSKVAAGSNGFTLTVAGSNYMNGATVLMGGTPLTTTYVSAMKLTAVVPASAILNSGPAPVTVSNGPTATSVQSNLTVVAPQIAYLSPNTVPAGSNGFTMTVNGSNFVTTSTVYWAGTALVTTVISDTQLSVSIPTSYVVSGGTKVVTVRSTAGAVSSNSNFTISPPKASTLTPNAIAAGSAGFTLTVMGTGYTPGAVVKWGTIPLTTTFVSATQLTADVPASAIAVAGSTPVTVMAASGSTSSPLTFTIAAPRIAVLSPNTAVAGNVGFTLSVAGTNFVSNAVVYFGATQLVTTYIGPTQLSAVVPASAIATAQTVSIVVNNTGSGGASGANLALSAKSNFVITPPKITSIAPSSAAAAGAGFTLTVTGSSFLASSVVQFGATPLATTYVSATQLTATVPASLLGTAGTTPITVANAGTATSTLVNFTVYPPRIASLSPASIPAGSPNQTMTVTGAYFVSGDTVVLDATPLTTTFVSATQLTADVPAALVASVGTSIVTVTTTTGATSAGAVLTLAAPKIQGLSPSTVVANSGPFTITVNGNNFVPSSNVVVGGTSLTTTYVSAGKLTATVPGALIAASGVLAVNVANSATVVSPNASLAVIAPKITGLSPATVAAGTNGTTITVYGSGFLATTVVKWSGQALTTTYVSATQITADAPASLLTSAGTSVITVSNGTGADSSSLTFLIGAPSIASLSPASAKAGSAGFTMTLTGGNFLPATTVMWGQTALTTTYVNGNKLTAVVPAALLTNVANINVTVANSAYATSQALLFKVTP